MTTQDQPDFQENKAGSVLAYTPSHLIALYTNAQWGHCYENSFRAFFAFPTLFFPDGKFVEGWVVFTSATRVALMEHSWLISGAVIIDPTLVLEITPNQAVFFYPGVIRSWTETDQLENELFPHVRFSDYGEDGMGHPGYNAAYVAAKQKAQELLTPTQKFVEVKATELSATQEQGETSDATEVIIVITKKGEEPEDPTQKRDQE